MADSSSHLSLASVIWTVHQGRTQRTFNSNSEGVEGTLALEPGVRDLGFSGPGSALRPWASPFLSLGFLSYTRWGSY